MVFTLDQIVYGSDDGSAKISDQLFKYNIAKRRLDHVTSFVNNG